MLSSINIFQRSVKIPHSVKIPQLYEARIQEREDDEPQDGREDLGLLLEGDVVRREDDAAPALPVAVGPPVRQGELGLKKN